MVPLHQVELSMNQLRLVLTPAAFCRNAPNIFPFGPAVVFCCFVCGCTPIPNPPQSAESQVVLSELSGGLLSVSGTSESDVYAVGADPGDGRGPLVLHYDGNNWARLDTGATRDLWWISDRQIDDSFFMVGEGGLALRYRPANGSFEQLNVPGDQTLFGVWGISADNVVAVGGDISDPDTSGVIWHFDGAEWSAADVSAIDPAGIPVLFKIWGRGENEIYAVGGRGIILRFDGTSWSNIASPTTRTLFTVHGNDNLVVATGGAQSGVIVESMGVMEFSDVTPFGTLQMNGTFVPPDGPPIAVGREGAVTLRRSGVWGNEVTGLNLNPTLDFHAAWIDPQGGFWAVGGNIVGEPRTDGVLAYFGEQTVGTGLVNP